jgi:hypothetical protein
MKTIIAFVLGFVIGAAVIIVFMTRYQYDNFGPYNFFSRRIDCWTGNIEFYADGTWSAENWKHQKK